MNAAQRRQAKRFAKRNWMDRFKIKHFGDTCIFTVEKFHQTGHIEGKIQFGLSAVRFYYHRISHNTLRNAKRIDK